jgi:hypothetical protein
MTLKEKRRLGILPFSMLKSLKIFIVLFVTHFLETHVLVITSLVICPWLSHRDHLGTLHTTQSFRNSVNTG